MKLNYFPDTDSLYIDRSERLSTDSREMSEGVVLDYDEAGNLVGIDIDNASRTVELDRSSVGRLPPLSDWPENIRLHVTPPRRSRATYRRA